MAIFSRVIAAIFGGYWVASVAAIVLASLLDGAQADRVLTAMLASYLIYCAVVIWVFAAKTAGKAWLGVMVPGLFNTAWIYLLPQSAA